MIPAAVRTSVIPGMPEPTDVGDCGLPVANGFNGYCEAYGVRLYLVGTRRDGRLMCADHAAERAGVPVGALPVLAMDAEERRYAEDCIEDNRRHRVLRGAEEWAEAREKEGRSVSHAFEGWAEKNWTGDDYAAAYVAWLHTTGHAVDPVHAWAVTGPVDRVQQAEVRLETARGQLAYAGAAHSSAQHYQGEAGRRQALERLHTANLAVAAAAADHAAEVTVRAEQEEGLDAPVTAPTDAVAVADRYRFGQPTGELGGRVVLVDGYVAGRVRESGRHWHAIESGRDALPTEHADRDSAAAHLVRCAGQRTDETRHRVRAEHTAAAVRCPESVPAALCAAATAPVVVPDRHHGRTVAEWKKWRTGTRCGPCAPDGPSRRYGSRWRGRPSGGPTPPRPPSPGGPRRPSPGSANSPGPPCGAPRWLRSCGCGSGGRRATPLRPGPARRAAELAQKLYKLRGRVGARA
ncbi:hypothetical protein ADK53_34040 [Streptomyces sp. WM6373]|uniref:hypothetical protein n=1 Tax=Streptomyces sp. WM6373 TaxID=1415556 RepID=UPI0006ADC8B2|nr:hypothetical protein [Streptomyces sp. WM6373]KOU28537.1 hypothetical protein ADK53_34040 [Streptomyces sp. WM6373]